MDTTLPAVFVLEPGAYVSASVIAFWNPASTLQVLGGGQRPSEMGVRTVIEHAVRYFQARTVVVCEEASRPPGAGAEEERLFARCHERLADPGVAALVREKGVAIEALWFDASEGDLYLWKPTAKHFELLADTGLELFLDTLFERAEGRT